MASKIYTVTVASGSSYGGGTGNVFYLDGVRNATGPGTVDWVAGATIRFNQDDSTNNNHPLIFSTTTATGGIISSNVTYYLDGASNQANYTNTTTFNAATVRYVEITPQSQTDFYYLCYVHGIGMGGIMDMVQNRWGALSWGANSWGTNVNSISVTGQPLTTTLGNEVAFPGQGWGANSWNVGEWGSVNTGNQLVTGLSMSMDIGQVDQTSSTGWGRNTWGSNVWNGYGTVIPSGVSATMALSTQILIDAEINRGWGRQGWNENAWGIGGQTMATGQAMSISQANVTVINEINTGWGSDGWGIEGWGESIMVVQPTGQVLTAFEGSSGIEFDGDSNLTLTGNSLTLSAPATVEAFSAFVAEPTGNAMTMSLSFDSEVVSTGSFPMSIALGTAIGDNITIAEISATSAVTWGNSNWGFGVYGNQQVNTLVMSMLENFSGVDPEPDAEATGQAMAINLSAISNFTIKGDATTRVLTAMGWGDSTWGNSKWGNGTYLAVPDVVFSLSANLGTAVLDANTIPTITGLPLLSCNVGTIAEVTGTATVPLTGNALTMGLGTATNVLIWNGVDPGTAPVDPPGWKEVSTNAA